MKEELKRFDSHKIHTLTFEDLNKMSNVKIDDKIDIEMGVIGQEMTGSDKESQAEDAVQIQRIF